jgi:hypothetical protein
MSSNLESQKQNFCNLQFLVIIQHLGVVNWEIKNVVITFLEGPPCLDLTFKKKVQRHSSKIV